MASSRAGTAFGHFEKSDRIARMLNNDLNIKFPLAIIVAMVFSAGCASSPDASDDDMSPEEIAASVDRRLDSDPNKRHCRTIRPTGTRFGERVCRTNAEWAQMETSSRDAVKAVQQDQNINTGGDGT